MGGTSPFWLRPCAALFFLASHGAAGQAHQQRVRVDFSAPVAVEARPSWTQGSSQYAFRQDNGVGVFEASDPFKGMKWTLGNQIDLRQWPVLRVRYRATRVNTESADYAVWLNTGGRGAIALRLCDLIADGQWHVAATDTRLAGYARTAGGLAVQVTGDRRGRAPRTGLDRVRFSVPESDPGSGPIARRADLLANGRGPRGGLAVSSQAIGNRRPQGAVVASVVRE